MTNILFVQPYASQVGGVDSVLLQLIAGLDKSIYHSYVLLPEPSAYAAKYEALGATVLFGPLAVFGKPTDAGYYVRNFFKMFRTMKAIREIVKAHRIDLIHSHKMETFGANIIGKRLGIPTVQTVHELPRKPLIAYKFVAYLNHVFNDKVIVLCDRSKVMFQWARRESSKLVKIYNGISDHGEFEPGERTNDLRTQLGFSSQDRVAITVARLSPMKGLEYLIEAAAALKTIMPDIKFVIVGDVAFSHESAYKDRLLGAIREKGLEQTVHMIGLRRDVPELLAQSDVMIVPSTYDIFPTVILEAMSSGLPIVATDVGGIPEMVRENTGLLVGPCDSVALRDAIIRLMGLDYREMGMNGKALFLKEFTQDRYVSHTAGLYEGLLRDKRKTS